MQINCRILLLYFVTRRCAVFAVTGAAVLLNSREFLRPSCRLPLNRRQPLNCCPPTSLPLPRLPRLPSQPNYLYFRDVWISRRHWVWTADPICTSPVVRTICKSLYASRSFTSSPGHIFQMRNSSRRPVFHHDIMDRIKPCTHLVIWSVIILLDSSYNFLLCQTSLYMPL